MPSFCSASHVSKVACQIARVPAETSLLHLTFAGPPPHGPEKLLHSRSRMSGNFAEERWKGKRGRDRSEKEATERERQEKERGKGMVKMEQWSKREFPPESLEKSSFGMRLRRIHCLPRLDSPAGRLADGIMPCLASLASAGVWGLGESGQDKQLKNRLEEFAASTLECLSLPLRKAQCFCPVGPRAVACQQVNLSPNLPKSNFQTSCLWNLHLSQP